MKMLEKNKVAATHMMVGIEKNIWCCSLELEARSKILERILPEYVGMKKVRVVLEKFRKEEAKNSQKELLISWNGFTYGVHEVEGKPVLVPFGIRKEEVRKQVVSIVTGVISPEDMEEFLEEYLEAVAEQSAFVDEIEALADSLKNELELLEAKFNIKKEKIIKERIPKCDNMIDSFDFLNRAKVMFKDFSKMIGEIRNYVGRITEEDYFALANFYNNVKEGVAKVTLGKEEKNEMETILSKLDAKILSIEVEPDYMPEGFHYLDGDILKHNYRIKLDTSENVDTDIIMVWISTCEINGVKVPGFFSTYMAESNIPNVFSSIGKFEELEDFQELPQFGIISFEDAIHYTFSRLFDSDGNMFPGSIERYSLNVNYDHTKRFDSRGKEIPLPRKRGNDYHKIYVKAISNKQYQAIDYWNKEIGTTIIKLWPTWAINDGGENTSYIVEKIINTMRIEKGKLIYEEVESTNFQRDHATYFVI